MSTTEIILHINKAIIVVLMLTLNIAGLLTWADRRYGAMLQDRVGPERAVVWLPKRLAQGLAFGPALLVGGGVIAFFLVFDADPGPVRTGRAMLFSQLAILATWLTALVIAGRVRTRGARNSFDVWIRSLGDPRRFFYLGLAGHALTFVIAGMFRGTPLGQQIRDFGYGAGPFVFAAVVVGGAGYAALQFEREERVGLRLLGLLHPAADGLKTIMKEDFIPPKSDKLLHGLAPFISFFPVLVLLAVVPFGDTLCFGSNAKGEIDITRLMPVVPRDGVCTEHAVDLMVVDLNVGLLYFFAMAGTGIVGAALAGWASNNKYSLLGGLRAASQMVSYEVTLGLTLIGCIMVFGTIRPDEMVRWQQDNAWGVFVQPFAFVLFFAAAVAETKRVPFDLPEGESEIVAGYFTEYSGMKFAMFFFSEYVAVVTSAALMATLFFGGWSLPFVYRDGIHIEIGSTVLYSQMVGHGTIVLLGVLAFVGKTVLLCLLQLTIRWTLPRFRYDQLMKLGWRKLLPASLANILVTGLVVLIIQGLSPAASGMLDTLADVTKAVVAVGGIVLGIWFVLFLLKPASHRRAVLNTSAEYAAARGGVRTAKMGA